MIKIDKFTPAQLSTLRRELNEKLAILGTDLGLNLSAGNISYSDTECTIKLTAKIKGALPRIASQIPEFGRFIGLDNVKYLSVFQTTRGKATLVDYKTRSPKYPWILELQNGNRIKVTDNGLKRMSMENS
jgi:hypothetical protein